MTNCRIASFFLFKEAILGVLCMERSVAFFSQKLTYVNKNSVI